VAVTIAILVIMAAVAVLMRGNKGHGVQDLGVESAQKLSVSSGVTILDVRTAQEFREGHLNGALHIPIAELSGRIGELVPLNKRQFLVYCLAGGRSAVACRILKKSGFSRVANMQGGISAWQRKGYPLVA